GSDGADPRRREDKERDLQLALAEADAQTAEVSTPQELAQRLHEVKHRYGLKSLRATEDGHKFALEGEINPSRREEKPLSVKRCRALGKHGRKMRQEGSGSPRRAYELAVTEIRRSRKKLERRRAEFEKAKEAFEAAQQAGAPAEELAKLG